VAGAYPVLHVGPFRPTRPWARTYRGTPASVPEARRFVGELLAGCPARETLMTCVSELCANAITHTASGRGGVFTVEVDCPRNGVARVAVTDDGGPSVPAAGRLDLMAEGGRGLAMVAACTTRWGFCEAYPGRTIWAEASWPVAVPSPRRREKVTALAAEHLSALTFGQINNKSMMGTVQLTDSEADRIITSGIAVFMRAYGPTASPS
jgi:Histidine kinase-like ATPase domain/AefR-like transcriptional repressor, C-terminal domain